jgi:tetratricopeptide (TPR) repeat protein
MFGGMGGGMGGPMGDMMGGEDDAEFMREMSGNSSSSSKPATESSATNKPAAKPDPRASLTESQRQAEEAKDLGNEAYKKKDFDLAITHYNKAIELEPTNITYQTNKAAVFFEQNKLTECIELCEKAIETGRENKADYTLIAK